VIERKRVTWSRKELGSKAPASFHTTDQKVRGSNPCGRTNGLNVKFINYENTVEPRYLQLLSLIVD
jgi:hypothetical protein